MKIEVLYPEVCNLYGDLMNAKYLSRSTGAEIINTSLKETPRFVNEKIELVIMGSTTEKGQLLVRDAFAPYKEALERRIEEGGVTLITGNAIEIFGEYIDEKDGPTEKMLGMFPIHSKRDMLKRFNSLYLGKMEDMTIVGFKSQFGHSYGDNGEGLFTTVRGPGLNPDVVPEGIRKNNFMATYLIGPIMVLNPPFAKYVLELMGEKEPKLEFEDTAMDVYKTRIAEFSEPNRGFSY